MFSMADSDCRFGTAKKEKQLSFIGSDNALWISQKKKTNVKKTEQIQKCKQTIEVRRTLINDKQCVYRTEYVAFKHSGMKSIVSIAKKYNWKEGGNKMPDACILDSKPLPKQISQLLWILSGVQKSLVALRVEHKMKQIDNSCWKHSNNQIHHQPSSIGTRTNGIQIRNDCRKYIIILFVPKISHANSEWIKLQQAFKHWRGHCILWLLRFTTVSLVGLHNSVSNKTH